MFEVLAPNIYTKGIIPCGAISFLPIQKFIISKAYPFLDGMQKRAEPAKL